MILTLTPNGNGGFAQHTRGPDTSGTNASKCQSDDGDVSYCFNYSTAAAPNLLQDCYAYTDPGVAYGTQKINSLTVKLTVKVATNAGSAVIAPVLRISPTVYLGSDATVTNGSYEVKSHTWTTNPSTGIAWTWAQVAAIQGGYRSQVAGDGSSPTELRITFSGIDVDFEKSFIPDSVPNVVVTPQQPTFTPPNHFDFIPDDAIAVLATLQQPSFSPNYFDITPLAPISVSTSPVQPTYSSDDVVLPRATSIGLGMKLRASGTMRSPLRQVITLGAQSPGIGLLLSGAADTFTATSHTYTATMKSRATVNAPTVSTVFADRACLWFKRDYDKSAILYLGLQADDVDAIGQYRLQFKAVHSTTGAVDFFDVIEVRVADDT